MRGPLIAKDDPPCGIESRFPRAPTTSDDRTMQSVTRWQARGGKRRDEPLPGANRLSLDMDASGRQYLRNVNTSFSQGVSAYKEYFERKSGADNIPAAVRTKTSLEALVKK